MIILGIESTCDETAAALVEDGRHLLSNVISTSVKEQALYGGVVPEIASRRHCEPAVLPRSVHRRSPAAATASLSVLRSKKPCWMQARPSTMWMPWPSPLRRA